MKRKKYDIILIGVILVSALIGFFVLYGFHNTGEKVVVTVNGEVYGTYDLNKNQTIHIKTKYGKNTLVIQDGKADMTDADCPDLICVKQSPLEDDTPRTIVCLPHKLVVEIKQ